MRHAEAGVVDQQVDRAVGVGEPVGHALHGGARSDRSAARISAATSYVARELVGDVLQPGPVARDEHEVVPALGELRGRRPGRCRPWRR